MCRVSDAGSMSESAAGREGRRPKASKRGNRDGGNVRCAAMPELSRVERIYNLETTKRVAHGNLMFHGTCSFNGLPVAEMTRPTILT